MRFRRGNRCWQCGEPLAINAQYCPKCGATPRPELSPDKSGTQVGGLLGWLIDNAVWIIAGIVLIVAAPLTIRAMANADDSTSRTENGSNVPVVPISGSFFDPLKAWSLSRVPNGSIPAEVVEIVSGDSFRMELRNEVVMVSLAGVIAPEIGELRWPGDCYADESHAQLNEVLPVGTTLYVDIEDAEEIGNGPISGYLWFADRGAQRAFLINELIVADGDAVGNLPLADREVGARIQVAENEARGERAGLWGACEATAATPSS
jgi:endonuclease YncB( thermonuclease family)